MKTQTNVEFLKAFKQRNKTSREVKATADGFKSAGAVIAFLTGEIAAGRGDNVYVAPGASIQEKKVVEKKVKKTFPTVIHVADVLDSSGSMSGGKNKAALKGINSGIDNLKKNVEPVSFTYTLCDFSDDIIFRHTLAGLDNVSHINIGTRGSTALYDAIGRTVEAIKPAVNAGDKVLVNVYTDGQENSSRAFRAQDVSNLIETLSAQGWTFTFIGTEEDVKYAQSKLKFDSSNTLVHDNTEKGMEKAFLVNNLSRSAYSTKVAKGEDVSKGFYKDIK